MYGRRMTILLFAGSSRPPADFVVPQGVQAILGPAPLPLHWPGRSHDGDLANVVGGPLLRQP
jgi:hypothetical protein